MVHFNPSYNNQDLNYGCHCFTAGEYTSQIGKGAPLDAVDSVCLKYKQCLKCAAEEFGDNCINEMVSYDANMNGAQPECTSIAGSCKRKLCECDKEFARAIASEMSSWNEQNSFSNENFDQDAVCVPSTVLSDPQCCGTDSSFSVLYNAMAGKCCSDS